MNILLTAAGILACILLSAYFSGSEMAISSLNRIRLQNEADKGSKGAARALKLEEKYDDTLSAILIGNNLVNIAASSLTTVFVILVSGSDRLNWAGTIVVTVLVIIFGETIPKIFCKKHATKTAVSVSGFLAFLKIVFLPVSVPVTGLVNLITKGIRQEETDDEDESVEELQSIIETAEDEGVLDAERSEMVSAAIDFSDTSADEVMTARVDVQAIDIDADRDEIIEMALESSHSRIPVYEGTIDHVIGVIHLNHLLKALAADENADIRSILMEPCFVYKTTKLPQVLDVLRKKRQHLAVVTDEYSGTLGVISMEDVLEQIVGDIWDETDEVEEEVIRVNEDQIRVDGDMAIADFLELLDIPEEGFDYESATAGGFAIEFFGDFPEEGDSFVFDRYTITVSEMDERRVTALLVSKNKEPEEGGETEEDSAGEKADKEKAGIREKTEKEKAGIREKDGTKEKETED
ncbi:MAG: HlyC/CorC family transporter [Lachnospiraceae bacterium]|nr:HlyC/CorC family transporter [Lachnospiraceae bacterium]